MSITSQNSSPHSFVSFGLFSHLRGWRMSPTSIKLQSVHRTPSMRHPCSRRATKGRSFRYFTLICDKGFQPAYAPSIRHIILNLISTPAARNQGYGEVLPRISVSHIEKRRTVSSQPAKKAVRSLGSSNETRSQQKKSWIVPKAFYQNGRRYKLKIPSCRCTSMLTDASYSCGLHSLICMHQLPASPLLAWPTSQ